MVKEIVDAGGKAHGIMADVSDPDAWAAMVEETREVFGPVDILVNNVGVRHRMKFEDITPEMWRNVLESNLSSCFYGARLVLARYARTQMGADHQHVWL